MSRVRVVGAGLAGCEAAYALARRGHSVSLIEMKPKKRTPAHATDGFAELVCSNSLKAMRVESAAGLLKAEMRLLGSLSLTVADSCAVPAGGALAVDRALFSRRITERILAEPNITVEHREYEDIDESVPTILATGPLTSGALAQSLSQMTGGFLSFFDAAAPIVSADSIDNTEVFAASRYGRGDADYLNCYFNKAEYELFWNELVNAKTATLHGEDKDQKLYEGCMPIERLAKRGIDSIRFGPLKPVGLTDPRTGHRPWAAVQLRKENAEATMYNIVGFQTNLTFGEQKRVFSMIPGLRAAEFVRYGVMHRNSFINSPKVLAPELYLRHHPSIYVAGQLAGFEGYMESAAAGILAARFLDCNLRGQAFGIPGEYTMTGSLLRYITAENKDFQPMGANMGLLPALGEHIKGKQERYAALAARALEQIQDFVGDD